MLSARSSRALAIRKSSWRNLAHHLGLFPKDLGVCAILFSASREHRVVVGQRSVELAKRPSPQLVPPIFDRGGSRRADCAPSEGVKLHLSRVSPDFAENRKKLRALDASFAA